MNPYFKSSSIFLSTSAGIREQPELLLEIDRRAVDAFLHVVAPPAETGHQTTVLRLGLGRLMKMLAEVCVVERRIGMGGRLLVGRFVSG